MKRLFPILVLTLLLLMMANVAPLTLQAQEPSPFFLGSIIVDIDVQDNGDLLVTETQHYVFTRTYESPLVHHIPLEKVDGIRDMQVSDVHVSGEGERVNVETDRESDPAQLEIRFGHSSIQVPGTHTWEIKYRVVGGLQVTDSGDRILWRVPSKDREAPISRGSVTVHLPESASIQSFRTLGVPANAQQSDRRTVQFGTRRSLQPGDALEVQVTIPHAELDVSIPEWQQAINQARTRNAAAIFTLAFLVLAALFLTRLRRWRIRYPKATQRETLPPTNLSAPAVSVLKSCAIGKETILSMAAEMYQKGLLAREMREGSYQISRLDSEALGRDDVGRAILKLMETRVSWEGYVSDLHRELQRLESSGTDDTTSLSPALIRGLADRLRALQNVLEAAGVKVDIGERNVRDLRVSLQKVEPHLAPISSALPWERTMLDGLRPVSDENLSDFHQAVRQSLGDHLKDIGLFSDNPLVAYDSYERARSNARVLGIVLSICLAVGILLWSSLLVSTWMAVVVGVAVVGIGFFVTGVTSTAIGKIAPTSEGIREISTWESYQKELKSTVSGDDGLPRSQFESHLPYAIALGTAKDEAFSSIEVAFGYPSIRETIRNPLTSLEPWLHFVVRGWVGLFLAFALVTFSWFITWLFFVNSTMGSTWFFLAQIFVVGVPAGLGAAVPWLARWTIVIPRSVQLQYVALTFGAALLVTWLAVEMRGVDAYYVLIEQPERDLSLLFLEISSSGFLPMLGANAGAAALFLYGMLGHREPWRR